MLYDTWWDIIQLGWGKKDLIRYKQIGYSLRMKCLYKSLKNSGI